MTTAERILERLNVYEQEQHDAGTANVWEDVIWAHAGKELDEEATNAADAAYKGTVAVFRDGSAVVWLEDERHWVAEVPA